MGVFRGVGFGILRGKKIGLVLVVRRGVQVPENEMVIWWVFIVL
jgi:hypothetical protein